MQRVMGYDSAMIAGGHGLAPIQWIMNDNGASLMTRQLRKTKEDPVRLVSGL